VCGEKGEGGLPFPSRYTSLWPGETFVPKLCVVLDEEEEIPFLLRRAFAPSQQKAILTENTQATGGTYLAKRRRRRKRNPGAPKCGLENL